MLCAEAFLRLSLRTHAVCTQFVIDPRNHHHTHTQKSARKSRENKIIVFTHSLLSASRESGPVPDLASGLPVALMQRQFARQHCFSSISHLFSALQPRISHLSGGCGEGALLLWEAVFVFKVALFTLKAKLIGGEWQGFVVRPWLCVGSC